MLCRCIWLPACGVTDGSGTIDSREFRSALTFIGVKATRVEMDALFASFDVERTGQLTLKDLTRILRRSDVVLTSELRRGAVPFKLRRVAPQVGGYVPWAIRARL